MALALSLFGDFALQRDGEDLELPASKKTRALLAYLALNPRPHRRERLCDLFWERTDDPRAALRWSLTKLRPLINDKELERLSADRERVLVHEDAFFTASDEVDDEPLADLDLPDCHAYQAWLVAERDRLLRITRGAASKDVPISHIHVEARQDIRFCRTADETMLAYGLSGEGPPLVKVANWLTHLEFDWTSPLDRQQIIGLSARHTLLRYDGRGNGLSDWETKEISFDLMVEDLETVIDSAGFLKFPLMGLSQGAAVAIEYAARHPDRVSHLVVHGGFAAGWKITGSESVREERDAVKMLLSTQWGSDNPSFRNLISTNFIPDCTVEEVDWFSDFQRKTTSARNVARFMDAFSTIDVRARLPEIAVPTLVMHSRGDQIVDIDSARELAANIPGARFQTLESDNHSLIDREPASKVFLERVSDFIAN